MKEAGELADCRLTKNERICSKLLIDQLFGGGGSRSMAAFPIRMVYMTVNRAADWPPVKIMVSVPKRCLKHAVERNRVKRLIRESWRKNKQELYNLCEKHTISLDVALVYTATVIHPYEEMLRKTSKVVKELIQCYEKEIQAAD